MLGGVDAHELQCIRPLLRVRESLGEDVRGHTLRFRVL